jgi:predicted patatin/cPLA2 family phospholipase
MSPSTLSAFARKRAATARWCGRFGLLAVIVLAAGCASVPERHPLPEAPKELPEVHGIPDARFWGDAQAAMASKLAQASPEEARARNPGIANHPHNYLAISGGGANGAFGAGLLNGWTASGTRPEFDLVTGISTGALAAPFAFLGPAYDAKIKEAYTSYSTKDIVRKRGTIEFLTGDSAADSAPLKSMLDKYMTDEVMRAIAAEWNKGRRLFIGTTNLDASRAVLWNIGIIAASGDPSALELIRKIMLASASIPVAFPPVYFQVEYDGKTYDEMHVDGGAAQQVFVYPAAIDWTQIMDKLGVPPGTSKVYVIRNAFIDPKWDPVKPKVLPIASRSIDSLIRTQGIGDLNRIYLLCQRDHIDFNLAQIPPSFDKKANEAFDKEYMQALYDLGFNLAKNGYPWQKKPPYYATSDENQASESK